MVQRVLLNSSGLKISKPGFDVTTAGVEDLAFDTSNMGLQVHFTTHVSTGSNVTTDISYPTLGYKPFFLYTIADNTGTYRQEFTGVNSPRVQIIADGTLRVITSTTYTNVRVVLFKARGL